VHTWYFTEDAYPHLPDANDYESIRVNLPNRNYDPVKGADLYHMYLDLWLQAEEHGLEIMLNEHHQTATCVVPAAPLLLAVLARQSKTAKLLILGNPIANRNQPVRVAEEMAMVDVISRGRLVCGFVRGVPWEASAANITAFRGGQRLWEAHDLIMKAWTTHDGPFNFEGRFYHHRQVNIWPRPYQQPHPPVWVTIGSGPSAVPVARKKYVGAVFLAGYAGIRKIFDGYREAYLAAHGAHSPVDRLAYASLVYVGETSKAAREGAEKLLWYMRSNKVTPYHSNPPGYHPPEVSVQYMLGQASIVPTNISLDDQMARGNVFAGTPDQVYEQIKAFWEYCGGFGNLIIMGQAGFLSYEDAVNSMRLYGKEVKPRLDELNRNYDPMKMKELRASMPDKPAAALGPFGLEFAR
jgi:alkanesulfonate monooxygenase SsuD/methylene tetrahydromethanopterin reductase-like flavin-dependent oxidoreductase (luciferase family)